VGFSLAATRQNAGRLEKPPLPSGVVNAPAATVFAVVMETDEELDRCNRSHAWPHEHVVASADASTAAEKIHRVIMMCFRPCSRYHCSESAGLLSALGAGGRKGLCDPHHRRRYYLRLVFLRDTSAISIPAHGFYAVQIRS
jgi:hypothetical protein